MAATLKKLIGMAAVLAGPLLSRVACALLGIAPSLLLDLAALTVVASAYTLDHALDGKLSSRVAAFAGAAHFGVVVATALAGHTAAAAVLVALPLSIIPYALPLSRSGIGGQKYRRVKDVPLAKPIYVAVIWSLLALVAALSSAVPARSWTIALAIGWIFGKVVVNATISDLRDVDADRAEHVASWPVVLGERRARVAAHVVNASFAMATAVLVAAGVGAKWMLWLELLAVVNAAGLLLAARRGVSRVLVADVVVDGGTTCALVLALMLAAAG